MRLNKNIIRNWLIFILIFVVLHFILSYTTGKFLSKKMRYQPKVDKTLRAYGKHIKILVLGDSHALHGVDTRLIPNSFNYADGGITYIQSYLKLKYILENHIAKPDLILLSIGWHNFSSFIIDYPGDDNVWMKFPDYIEVGWHRRKLFYYINLWLHTKIPYFSTGWDMANYILHGIPKPAWDYKKDMLHDMVWTRKTEIKDRDLSTIDKKTRMDEIAFNLNHQFKNYDIFCKDQVYYFEKIIELCKENNIKLILFRIPATGEYMEEMKKFIDFDKLQNEVNSLIKKHNLILIDSQDFFKGRMYLFRDHHHPNDLGSVVLTKELIRRIAPYYPKIAN